MPIRKYWGKHSPVLFPIVGALKNDTYQYSGKDYLLTRHGFARDNDFTIIAQTESSITFSLIANVNTKQNYPFEFELLLTYTLKGKKLYFDYTVINNDSKPMPFALGAHPAFALPKNFSSYSLFFEQNEMLESYSLQDNLLTDYTSQITLQNTSLPLCYSLFMNDALVFKKIKSDFIAIAENNIVFLKVHLGNFPHLGLWTKANAPFICIEPWQGYADTLTASGDIMDKKGIIIAQPDTTINRGFFIEVV